MSTRDRNAQPIRRTRSQLRRNIVLNVDLNAAPPAENRDQEETPVHVVSGDTKDGLRGASLTLAAIDVEALDDDVIISSPRAFAAVKDAVELFKKLVREKICEPNEIMYATVMNGLSKRGILKKL